MVIGRAMAFLGGRKATMAMRCWEALGFGLRDAAFGFRASKT